MKVNKHANSANHVPWDEQGPAQVRALRRAITAHREDTPVDAELAPMMGDMLARIDDFVEPQTPQITAPPILKAGARPPSAARALQSMSAATTQLKQFAQTNPQYTDRIDAMIRVIERHVTMKREIVQRVQLTEQST